MKYTKYLWNKNVVDLDSIQTENPLLKYPIQLMSVPVAILGIMTIGSVMPIAIFFDELRNVKCQVIHIKRNHKNIL